MMHEPGTIRSDWIEPFAKLSNSSRLPHQRERDVRRHEGPAPLRARQASGKGAPVDNSLFSLYGVKIVGDGSNQTETGAQTEPYLNSTSKGSPNFDAAQMKQMVAEVKAFGLPVQIHCQRRLHDRHCARRDRGGLRGLDRLWRQPHRARDDGAPRSDSADEDAQR